MSTLCKCGKESRPRQRTCSDCHLAYMRKYRKSGGRLGKLVRAIDEHIVQERELNRADPVYWNGYHSALRWVKVQIKG